LDSPIGLDPDLEAFSVQGVDQVAVELQQRLPAGADDIGSARGSARPLPGHRVRKSAGGGEFPAPRTIGADKIRIAEIAGGARAILFASAPQIASGEAQEHRGAPGSRSLALERVIDFLDLIGHFTSAPR